MEPGVNAKCGAWRSVRQRLLPDESRRGRAYVLLRCLMAYGSTPSRVTARQFVPSKEFQEYERFQTAYRHFQRTFEPSDAVLEQQVLEARTWRDRPSLSIVTPVFAPSLEIFRQAVESVRAQTYPDWVWHVADASPDDRIWGYLVDQASADSRIRPIRLPANMGIAANTNEALRAALGDFIVMFDHDDTLAPFALYAVAQVIREHPEIDFIYSDSDKLDEHGARCEPFFKPDWSPELLLCCNYLDQLAVFSRPLLDRVGWLDPQLDGAQDWDFYLRVGEQTQSIFHIPQVLYHWRKTSQSTAASLANKPWAGVAQKHAISQHLERCGFPQARVEFDQDHPVHAEYPKLTWERSPERKVSIILPTLDHAEMLSTCLQGLLERTSYANLEVILVDTGSSEAATHELYATLADERRVSIVHYREPFNFSKVCNFGFRHATGDVILLLNNDIEILHADWLTRMTQWLERTGVGIVGAKLLFPDGRIEHGGIVIGFGGLAAPLFRNGPEHVSSIFGREGWYRNVSAVSGGCLMTSRMLYEELGGLDETFLLMYSDSDFCLRARAAGYRVVLTPDSRLVHHESVTHGGQVPRQDFLRATDSFRSLLRNGDPCFNPNLSCHNCHPSLRPEPRDNALDANLDLLRRLPEKEVLQLPHDLQ